MSACRDAYFCAVHASRVYDDPDDAREQCEYEGLTRFAPIYCSDSGTECYVAGDDERTVIAFRGTQDVADWRNNLDRELTKHYRCDGRAHRGFYGAWLSVSKAVRNALGEPRECIGRKMYVTGHSLGAALASLCAYELAHRGYTVSGVHLFGSPRVGDQGWAEHYEHWLGHVTYRHVNCCDIVPRVPPMWFGYRHVGKVIYYNARGNYHYQPSQLYMFLDRIQARIEHFGRLGTRGLLDHSMRRGYLRLAREAAR